MTTLLITNLDERVKQDAEDICLTTGINLETLFTSFIVGLKTYRHAVSEVAVSEVNEKEILLSILDNQRKIREKGISPKMKEAFASLDRGDFRPDFEVRLP